MSVEDFANCYANGVSGDVDTIVNQVNSVGGSDTVKAIASWWSSLPSSVQAVVTFIAGYGGAKLGPWITAAVGASASELVILFLGGASWEILISNIVSCAEKA
jgi:predicted Abi (CAAX) family protease